MRKVLLSLVLLPLLAACAHDVSATTSSRIYENVPIDKITNALPAAFTRSGYVIGDAKLVTSNQSVITNGNKSETVAYTYKSPTLPDGDCIKFGSANVLAMPQPNKASMHLVSLQVVDATCYNAIKKMSFGIETNPKYYQQFFDALDGLLGSNGVAPGIRN